MHLQIVRLFNSIIVSGKIPNEWKLSKITMQEAAVFGPIFR